MLRVTKWTKSVYHIKRERKKAVQILNFPLVLHPKPLVRVIGRVR